MARTTQDLTATQIFYSNNASSDEPNVRHWSTQRHWGAGQLRGRVESIELWMGGSEVYWPNATLFLSVKKSNGVIASGRQLSKQWGIRPAEVDFGWIPNDWYTIVSSVWINSSVYTGADAGTWRAYLNHEIA